MLDPSSRRTNLRPPESTTMACRLTVFQSRTIVCGSMGCCARIARGATLSAATVIAAQSTDCVANVMIAPDSLIPPARPASVSTPSVPRPDPFRLQPASGRAGTSRRVGRRIASSSPLHLPGRRLTPAHATIRPLPAAECRRRRHDSCIAPRAGGEPHVPLCPFTRHRPNAHAVGSL